MKRNPRSLRSFSHQFLSDRDLELASVFIEEGKKPALVEILYNKDEPEHGPSDEPPRDDSFVAHEADAIRALGHEVVCRGVSYNNLGSLKEVRGDFVFNLCDGVGLDGDPGVEVISLLEKSLVPFSGVGSSPCQMTNDKWAMKIALRAAGVPVPDGVTIGHLGLSIPKRLRYPLFIKPRYGWGSQGVSDISVAHSLRQCRLSCEKIIEQFGSDALVEEYIEGREITVGVMGAGERSVVMPPLEVVFGAAYEGHARVRSYATKNDPDSTLYWDFQTLCPAPLEPEVRARVEEVALSAYRAVGADGYGRVDMRLSSDGIPYVLEVNGNPSLEEASEASDCGMLPLMGRAVGWSFSELLACIIGAGRLRPLRHYRPALATLAQFGGETFMQACSNIAKGTRIVPAGTFVAAPKSVTPNESFVSQRGRPLFAEPHLRALLQADAPNVGIERVGGQLWLVAKQSLKLGERLAVNRALPIELAGQAAEYPAFSALYRTRSVRRL